MKVVPFANVLSFQTWPISDHRKQIEKLAQFYIINGDTNSHYERGLFHVILFPVYPYSLGKCWKTYNYRFILIVRYCQVITMVTQLRQRLVNLTLVCSGKTELRLLFYSSISRNGVRPHQNEYSSCLEAVVLVHRSVGNYYLLNVLSFNFATIKEH